MQIDQKLIDEQSKMSQKKSIVQSTEGIRADLQTVQRKVKDINDILSKQDKIIEIINYTTKIVPSSMKVSSVDVNSTSVRLSATTNQYRLIQGIQKRLQKEARFEKIEVGGIARDKNGVYTLAISLDGWKGPAEEKAADPNQDPLKQDEVKSEQ